MKESAAYSRMGPVQVICLRNWTKPYPLHNHVSVYTTGLVIRGKAALTLAGREIQTEAGEAFIVFPYEPHALSPLGPMDMVSLCLPKEIAGRDAAGLKTLIQVVIRSLREEGTLQAEDDAAFSRVLGNAFTPSEAARERGEAPFVARVRRFLECSPETRVSLRQFAEDASVCEDHLIRKFKKQVGLTPRYFQIQNRVRRAQLLLEQKIPISEAALSVGFYDQSHFDRYFRHFLGISPRDYVKACKTPPE
ncbi:MAG: AraC family transcriptional regulator [Synergistaceae bacterium]|nr:AraC family transcriptional regulator [Synergistaceae bacterium]